MTDSVSSQNWARVAFGDVVAQVKRRVDPEVTDLERFVAGEHMTTDDLRIRRWGNIGDGYLGPAFHVGFKPGQVLYGSRRTYLRKAALADFSGVTANTTFVLESADPEVLLPGFLPYVLKTDAFNAHSVRESRGSVNPYVNFSDLAWFQFDLPPIAEQWTMCVGLDALWGATDCLHALDLSSEQMYLSVASALFTSTGVGIKPSAWAPSDWPCSPLADLVDPDAPVCYGIVQVGAHDPSGVPTLAIKDLGDVSGESVHLTSAEIESRFVRSRVQAGDLLVSIKATIGEVAVVPEGFCGNISRDLARLRVDESDLAVRYLYHLFRSPPFRRYIDSLVVGSTRAELSIAAIREMEVPVPPRKEQDRIVDKLDAVEYSRREIAGRLRTSRDLAIAGTNRMLTGSRCL